jgi:two-component system, LytTR family, sensor histidine kinase LytS
MARLELISVHLFEKMSLIFVLVFFFSRFSVFQNIMIKKKTTLLEKTILIIFFGGISILGTYTGFPLDNAIANTRAVGIIVAGLLAGPIVGTGVGLISGLHRFVLGGLSINAAFISAVLQGYLAGKYSQKSDYKRGKLLEVFFVGIVLEVIHMIIVVMVTRPVDEAIELVKIIGLPMIVINPIGIMLFITILESIYKEQEKIQGRAAGVALKIANQTLPFLRKGLNAYSAKKTAEIIYDMVNSFEVVCITSTEIILAKIGNIENIDLPQNDEIINSRSILKALETGEIISLTEKKTGDKLLKNKSNFNKLIVPLKENERVVGALVLYKFYQNNVTQFEMKLTEGLAQLISTQLEISKVQYQSKLIAQAEIRALQSQINPHFLFNALNTIVYYCTKDTEKAKDLIIYLGEFYRNNLKDLNKMVKLETEIEHVKAYVFIEISRFEGKLKVEYDIQPNCICLVPPLILQPIVENAIKHGILPSNNGGIVKIKGTKEKNGIKLIIEDNGVGMSDETLKSIFSGNREKNHIGLKNVYNRLGQIYGNKDVFSIISQFGVGTKVTILIPNNKEV